jgi:hypothetical protein
MIYIIVYNDNTDKTITRLCVSMPIHLEVGSTNGFGWLVISIQELYEKSFYTKETIYILIEKERKNMENRNSLIKKIINVIDILLK